MQVAKASILIVHRNTKLQNDQDLKAYMSVDAITSWSQPSVVMLNGANLLVTELGPGAMSPMHRTVSIDFSIVTNGEVDHELDGCETVQLRPGNHIIQRGTNHRWRDASSTKPARILAVTMACEPLILPVKKLKKPGLLNF
ncbi:hypothetical protein MMC08_002752 [Hypocenomyce scalaris]|nr:hypothetical protein [Hypocenomyce scalaris]